MTMAKLPKRIHVGPLAYEVDATRRTLTEYRASMGRPGLMGASDHHALVIALDPDQADGQARDTLLHECLHAVAVQTGLDATWDDDEQVIRRLTPALLDLLRRNPRLVAYLTAD